MPMFNEWVSQLQAREPLPPLYPSQPWDTTLSRRIAHASAEELLGQSASGRPQEDAVDSCRAGLLLWNDDLEASHSITQNIEDATGSFWHAIMHRREGDAANSHYWWRRTGAHPAFADVYREVMSLLENEAGPEAEDFAATLRRTGTWAPMEFIARCELARRGQLESNWLQRVQVAEMAALLTWCRDQTSR